MENPHFTRDYSSFIWFLCFPGYISHVQGKCSLTVAFLDSNHCYDCSSVYCIRCAQVRRSRNGRFEVSVASKISHVIFLNACIRSLRPLVVALLPGHQRHLDKIKDMRVRLSNELVEVINEYGPKIYEDFNEVRSIHCLHASAPIKSPQFRIMIPSASAPPSSGNPGLWRRKSSVGAVDAQGNLLVHPMVSLPVSPLYATCSERLLCAIDLAG
jgi:hypothetical protein